MSKLVYCVNAEPEKIPYYFTNKKEAEKFSKKVKGSYVIEARVNNSIQEGIEEYEYYSETKGC